MVLTWLTILRLNFHVRHTTRSYSAMIHLKLNKCISNFFNYQNIAQPQSFTVYFSSKYLIDLKSVVTLAEVERNSFIPIRGEERKYNKSLAGIYSHQVPIICLSAIKIPANVLSSDQVVQCWQFWSWTGERPPIQYLIHHYWVLPFLTFRDMTVKQGLLFV